MPHSWINGIDSQIESLINNGLNLNRKFKVFWSEIRDAFDAHNIPLASYKPVNSSVNLNARECEFPQEGWYECQIRRFKSKFTPKYTYIYINFTKHCMSPSMSL